MKNVFKILALSTLFFCAVARTNAQISASISVRMAPPPLEVYTQPDCPEDGYIWTPGYWAYGSDGYYWVPGVWVAPPSPGLLWTPPYWGYNGSMYVWYPGYWGNTVGFYGGVIYGYGYSGVGYDGGRWQGSHFYYNTAISHVNNRIVHNVYVDKTVVHNSSNHQSFNGRGGITAKPSQQEQAASRGNHVQATSLQATHHQSAIQDRNQFSSPQQSHPATATMDRINGNHFNSMGHSAAMGGGHGGGGGHH